MVHDERYGAAMSRGEKSPLQFVRLVVAMILGPIALLAWCGLGATFERGPSGVAWGFRLVLGIVLILCCGGLYAVRRPFDDGPRTD